MMTLLLRRLMRLPCQWALLVLAGGLLLLAGPVRGQSSTTPCLEVLNPTTRQPVTFLCVGQTYELHKCGSPPPAGAVSYDTTGGVRFDYPGQSTVLRFAKPGRRVIKQLINVGGAGGIDSVAYEVYPTAPPRVRVEPCLGSILVTVFNSPTTPYSGYRAKISFGNRTRNFFPTPGGTVSDDTVGATAAVTVRVTVTGSNAIFPPPPADPFPACPTSTPFDTTFILPALPPPPRIQLLDVLAPTAPQQVRLHLTRLLPGTSYVIESAPALTIPGPWTVFPTPPIQPTTDTFSITLTGAPTATRHRYRLRQLRGVGCDANLPDAVLLSNEAGASPLTRVTVGAGGAVTVEWPDYPAVGTVLNWRIHRDGREIARVPLAARSYLDTARVGCPQDRCYEVAAAVLSPGFVPADTLFAFSGDLCARTTPVPPVAPRLKASFDLSNNLVLRATPPLPALAASFEFTETRPGPPPNSTVLTTTPQPRLTLTAPPLDLVRDACYSVVLADTCAQRSAASAEACPTVLSGQRSLDGLSAVLSWTPYRSFGPTTTYTIELLDDQTNAVIGRVLSPPGTFTHTDPVPGRNRQVLRYRIRAEVPGDTSRVVYSNFLDLTEQQLVRLPTAFTPNGDNLNDTFGPVGRYELREQELTIFDRWGRELFRTTTPGQNWDGRPPGGGDVVPPGVFAYRFRGRDAAGHEFIQKGTVTVLR